MAIESDLTSVTRQDAIRFLALFSEMRQVYESKADDETKYDLVLGIAANLRRAGMRVRYCDPDATYAEDTRACYYAYAERAHQLALAFGQPTE